VAQPTWRDLLLASSGRKSPEADISGLIAALRERDNLKRPDQIFGTEDYEATRLHHAVPQRHGRFVREHNSQP